MKIKKLVYAVSALVVSMASLLMLSTPLVHATGAPYTCTWTGGGTDNNFSTAANWTGCNSAAPVTSDNDSLVFPVPIACSAPAICSTSPNDDISGLNIANISFTGTSNTQFYTLSGDTITITGGVTDTTTANATDIQNTLIISGNQTFSTANVTNYASLQGSGNITVTGGGQVNFDNTGAGSPQTLANYTGTISSTDSQVELGTYDTFTSSGSVVISSNGVLDLSDENGRDGDVTFNLPISLGGIGGSKIGTLNLTGGQGLGVTLAGPLTLTSDIDVTDLLDTNITLNITGPITYNGHSISGGQNVATVTVGAGDDQSGQNPTIGSNVTYVVDGKLGNVTVGSGGMLKGADGTLSSLSLNSGGIVSPGHSPGCLTVSGALSGGGTYQEEIQSPGNTACTDYDQIRVAGTVNLTNATLNTSLLNSFAPSVGQTFEVIDNQSASSVTGTFNGLAEGTTFAVGTTKFKITYKGGDGNDVVLTVVKASTALGAPNTGLASIIVNPLQAFASSILAATLLVIIAWRLQPVRK